MEENKKNKVLLQQKKISFYNIKFIIIFFY